MCGKKMCRYKLIIKKQVNENNHVVFVGNTEEIRSLTEIFISTACSISKIYYTTHAVLIPDISYVCTYIHRCLQTHLHICLFSLN